MLEQANSRFGLILRKNNSMVILKDHEILFKGRKSQLDSVNIKYIMGNVELQKLIWFLPGIG